MPIDMDSARAMPRAILDAADFRAARVLEVGAGDGRLTFQYAAGTTAVVGIDTNESAIRTASRSWRMDCRADVQFLCANAAALPFPAEQFGIVLLASSL